MSAALTLIVFDPTGEIPLGVVAERFDVHAFHQPADVLSAVSHLNPAAVVLVNNEAGIGACERITSRQPGLPILLLDDVCSPDGILAAMRAGARDVIPTNVDGWQQHLARRLEAGFAWRHALDRGQEVQMAALRAIAERSQIDLVNLEVEISTLKEQLEAERAVVQQTQSRLEIQRGLAMTAVRAKAAFLSNISHEFKTPLNAIVGYAELVREQTEHGQVDLDRIIQTSRHLSGLVQTVLDLARLESGDINPVFETVAVNELLARTVGKLALRAKEQRVDLVIEPFTVDTVVTDPLRLQDALLRILDNAIKFCGGGTVVVEVAEGLEETLFSVRDDGMGMDPKSLEEVFTAFAHADESDSRTHGGAGLGLAIAYQTARVLGGTLSAESAPGKGSTFTIAIPNAVAGVVSSELERELTVMIVDDDPVLRKVLERMLVADGHAALTTGVPEEAVELARKHQPSLIALDVMLPGIDGWTLLNELINDPEVRHIPIVIISATDQSERALEEGARAFLDKPIDRKALRDVIRAHAPQAHRVLVMGPEVPAWLQGLEAPDYAVRPCRIEELEDALPSRAGTVVFPLDVDPSDGVRALRLLGRRSDIRCVAIGKMTDAERTFLAGRFHGVAEPDGACTLVRRLADVVS